METFFFVSSFPNLFQETYKPLQTFRSKSNRDPSCDNILQTTKRKKKKEEEGTKKNEHDVIVGNPDLSPKRETREEDLGLFVRGRREKRRGSHERFAIHQPRNWMRVYEYRERVERVTEEEHSRCNGGGYGGGSGRGKRRI